MLEEKIDLLIKETVKLRQAVEANTAALGAGGGATTGKGPGRPKKDEAEPSKFTAAEVQAMANRLKDEASVAVAKELIKKHGGSDLNALVTSGKAKWPAFMADAESKLTPDDEPAPEVEDEL